MDIKVGGSLDAFDATDYLRIEIPKASDICVIARAGDDKINIHGSHATLTIHEFKLHAIMPEVPCLDQLRAVQQTGTFPNTRFWIHHGDAGPA